MGLTANIFTLSEEDETFVSNLVKIVRSYGVRETKENEGRYSADRAQLLVGLRPERPPGATLDGCGHLWLDMAMKQVKIAELKDRLSEHLRAVEKGAEVVVTDRDRPIARIVPILQPRRRARVLPPSLPFPNIRERRRTRARWAISSTDLLLEERQER